MSPKVQPPIKKSKAPQSLPQPLTIKELKVLEFIELFMLEQAVAPTFQEIREHFGFASFNSVQRYIKQLQDKNYISIPAGNQKRALQVLHSSKSISNLLSDRMSDPGAIVTNPHPALSQTLSGSLKSKASHLEQNASPPRISSSDQVGAESLSLPLLGRVAAGAPIEAFTHDEFINVPASLIRNPGKTFALVVQGQSMVEDGILDGDVIFVQKQTYANNGETVVAMVNNQATVKRFYLHSKKDIHRNPQTTAHSAGAEKMIELRPANSTMQSMWHVPFAVDIQGIVVGLIRRF